MLDYRLQHARREMQRDKDSTEFRLRSELDLEKLKATTEDELKHLILQQELAFVEAGVRAHELEKLAHDLQLLTIQRRAGYEQALEDAKNKVDRAAIRKQLTALDLDSEAMKQEHRLRIARLQEEQSLAIASDRHQH